MGSGRGGGGVPAKVMVPVMTPGPSAVSVGAAGAVGLAGSLPPPHAIASTTAVKPHVNRLNVIRLDIRPIITDGTFEI
jgi:hypothetical protein